MLDTIIIQFSLCLEVASFQWWVKQLCLSCSYVKACHVNILLYLDFKLLH